MKATSKHLDSDKKETRAAGESKKSGLMDGIVTGLPKRVSPVIVDGIVRGVSKIHPSLPPPTTKIVHSSTPNSKGSFGSGNFPEGHM